MHVRVIFSLSVWFVYVNEQSVAWRLTKSDACRCAWLLTSDPELDLPFDDVKYAPRIPGMR